MSNIPERIGRYSILERLAVGGMAVVYLAFETGDDALQRLVVIKQILPKFDDDEGFRRMFLQEARLAANISHPNVVEIHEMGSWEEQPFLAMEYVSGVPLNILMRHAMGNSVRFPVGVAIGIIVQACAGAHTAHELTDATGEPAKLVHRDLTPHNLMVSEAGHVKILDFGVAKATSNQDETQTGVLKGKLPYMSPEQLWQKDVDRRSDVFTLGVVLWELLLGSRLYARDGEAATINAVLNSTLPQIEGIRPDVPREVLAAAMGALEKDPAKRTGTAEELRLALVDAARISQLDFSEDAIRTFVDGELGPSLAARKSEVQAQIEKSIHHMAATTTQKTPVPSPVTARPPQDTIGGIKRGMALGAGVATVLIGVGLAVVMLTRGLDNTATTPLSTNVSGPGLTIILAPTVNPEILQRDLEPLRKYLQRKMEMEVSWRFADTYAATSEALLNGEAQFASLPPTLYVQTVAAHPEVELIAVKVHSGSSGSDGVLLVSEDGPIQSLKDIAGKRLCYTDPQSTTGYMLPRAALRDAGIDPDRDMQRPAIISGNHLQLIKDIIERKCDVGGTFTAAYMNADEAGINAARTRVLQVTGRTPHDAISAAPGVDADLKLRMREALLEFDPKTETGLESVGGVERLTGFAPVTDSVYDKVRKAVDAERQSAFTEAP
jgi:phosphate/phosphite/phosphonate ABC transporter binding protein